ncbi:MAG TPA: PaaI family thioesterase [Planctomycetota bacterium]|nr:PaaI family thioesterase [Planctomycetota bacterium]
MSDGEAARRGIRPHYDATKVTGAEKWAQKRRLADAMRLVIERLVPSDAPEDELRRAAEGLERYADALRAHPRLKRAVGHAESANAGDVGAFFDQSPLIGLANPLAPPILVGQTGPRSAAATVIFGSAYEGPPGSVHGGFVAAAFDEVLGYVQSLSGKSGFTGTLTVRYRNPTPLHEELRIECELVRVEGRKIFAAGRLSAASVGLCAESEAVFVAVDEARVAPLLARRAAYEASQSPPSDPSAD